MQRLLGADVHSRPVREVRPSILQGVRAQAALRDMSCPLHACRKEGRREGEDVKARVQRGSMLRGEVAEADDLAYIVIFSDDGDPVLAVEQVGRNHIQVTHAKDDTFDVILARLGVHPARTQT